MKRCLFLCVLLLLLLSLKAQQQADAAKIKEIDSLLDLCHDNLVKINTESVVEYASQALPLSEAIDYSLGKTKAYFYIGQTLYNIGSYKKSLEYLSLAEKEQYAAKTPLMLFEISRVRGQIYLYLELPDASLREFEKCLSHLRKLELKHHRDYCASMTYENFSVVYEKIGKTDSALYYMDMNRELLEPMDEPFIFPHKINMYTSLANHHAQQNDFDLAVNYFNQALNLAEKYEHPYVSRTYMYMGDMEMKKGCVDSALNYYFTALENLEKTKLKSEFPALYDKVSNIYEQKGAPDSAKLYKEKQIFIENELSQEKVSTVEQVLQILIKEEKNDLEKSQSTALAIIGVCLLVAGITAYALWRRSHRKLAFTLTREKEIETTELKQKLNESFEEITKLAKANDSTFLARFQDAYPEFTSNLLQKHPDLLNSELLLCAMIFFNFSSKEIASYTFVEHRSVQTKKSRLRKKLNLSPDICLYQYMKSFS